MYLPNVCINVWGGTPKITVHVDGSRKHQKLDHTFEKIMKKDYDSE